MKLKLNFLSRITISSISTMASIIIFTKVYHMPVCTKTHIMFITAIMLLVGVFYILEI